MMDKKTRNILIAIAVMAVITVSFFLIKGGLQSTGDYSTKLACDAQRTKLMSGYYVACTECSTKYSGNTWYAAGCFTSGTNGEQCLKAGGTCNDVYCTACTGTTRTCIESQTRSSLDSDTTKDVYTVANWGDVCDRTVFRTVCKSGYTRSGAEYSTYNNIATCNPNTVVIPPTTTTPSTTCTAKYATECSTDDGCGHTRVTNGNACLNKNYCVGGQCLDSCAGQPSFRCVGTTKESTPTNSYVDGKATCLYKDTQINSADCGFVAPLNPIDESSVACATCDSPIISDTATQTATGEETKSWWTKFIDWLASIFSA